MSAIPPRQMIAFTRELHKTAAAPGLLQRAAQRVQHYFSPQELAGRYGRQVMLGAGLGAGTNIVRHQLHDTPEEKAQGSMLAQALHGAGAGAAVAGGRILATSEGRRRAGEAAKRWYERERYGITGRGLDPKTEAGLEEARRIGVVPKAPSYKHYLGVDRTVSPGEVVKEVEREGPLSASDMVRFQKQHKQTRAAEELFKKDWASAPGGIHGLLTQPQEYLKTRWQSMDPMGKALTGLGVVGTGRALARGPSKQEEQQGRGRFSSGLGTLGATVGNVVAPWTSMLSGMALPAAAQGLGRAVGHVGDIGEAAVRSRGRVVPAEEQAQWQTQG